MSLRRRATAGRLVVGTLEGKRVALFQGRGHYYEYGRPARDERSRSKTFKRLGGKTLFLTNAAGGLHPEWTPPALVAIVDHINLRVWAPIR